MFEKTYLTKNSFVFVFSEIEENKAAREEVKIINSYAFFLVLLS